MIKLNNEQAKAAWADYKEFNGFGQSHQTTIIKSIEQAFKMGFAMGASSKDEVEQTEQSEPKQMELLPLTLKPLKVSREGKTNITREYKGRNKRTYDQRAKEAQLVASILKSNGQMYLQNIINAVNNAGCNWSETSASGFMKDAMEYQKNIKKVGFGIYAYEG